MDEYEKEKERYIEGGTRTMITGRKIIEVIKKPQWIKKYGKTIRTEQMVMKDLGNEPIGINIEPNLDNELYLVLDDNTIIRVQTSEWGGIDLWKKKNMKEEENKEQGL